MKVMKQIELKTRSPREILGGVPPFEQFEDEEEPELFPETDAAAGSGTATISPRGGGLFAGADADEAVIIHGNAADLVLQALLDRFDSPPSAEQQAVLDAVTAIAAEESSPILRARTSVTQGFIIDALTVADADDVEHTIEELVAFHDMEAAGTLDTVARKAHQAMYVQLRKQIRKASLTSSKAAAAEALQIAVRPDLNVALDPLPAGNQAVVIHLMPPRAELENAMAPDRLCACSSDIPSCVMGGSMFFVRAYCSSY